MCYLDRYGEFKYTHTVVGKNGVLIFRRSWFSARPSYSHANRDLQLVDYLEDWHIDLLIYCFL